MPEAVATLRVIFRDDQGGSWEVPGVVGESVMDCALDNHVPGIAAQCGGAAHCSTCHCYLAEPWFSRVGVPRGDEAEVLAFTPHRRPNSRLSCQIELHAGLDGLEVIVPSPT